MNELVTPDRLKEVLNYDPESGLFTWLCVPNNRITIGQIAGNIGIQGYVIIKVDRRLYRAHRLAWLYMTGQWPKAQIDHRDLNATNNSWANLREATRSQNCYNQGARTNNTSGYKGVSWHKASGKWTAQTRINGKAAHLGLFGTAELAHRAYIEAAREHHGEFARVA